MKEMTKTAIAIAAGMLCSVCLADVRTWGGGSGKWSVPANWEGGAVPQNGDSVVINAESDLIEVENDISGLSLVKLTLANNSQPGAIYLKGEKLTFTANATVLDATCVFTNAMPLVFANNTHYNPNVSATRGCAFLGDIEALGNFFVSTSAGLNIDFYGKVHGENAIIKPTGGNNNYRFYAPVEVKGVVGSDAWCSCQYEFYASGNSWETNDLSYGVCIVAKTANAFPTNMVMRWKECRTTAEELAKYTLAGDETIDRIESAMRQWTGNENKFAVGFVNNWGSLTLTLKATASAWCNARLNPNGSMTLVYDPQGDYVQTFADRSHAADSTHKIVGIKVRGGTLESSGANTFAAVTDLEIDPSARFKVSASAISSGCNPFGNGTADAVIHYGGVVEVCSGVTVTLRSLQANGVVVPVNTYQALDGTDPDAEKVSWVEGGGLVSVSTAEDATCWKTAANGAWSDASNWTDGVPTAGRKTYITAEGADYAITIPAGTTIPAEMTVGNTAGSAHLSFGSGAHSVSSWNWTIENGGVVDVPVGANVKCDSGRTANAQVNVSGGGQFLVSGGDVMFTNMYRTASASFAVGGTGSLTGRVTVTGGAFHYVPYIGSTFNLNESGIVELAGGLFDIPTMKSAAANVFIVNGGEIRATGGEYRTSGGDRFGWPTFMESGTFFGGDSIFTTHSSDTVTVRPSGSGETAKLEFSGTAAWTNRCSLVKVGDAVGGSSILSFCSDATHGAIVQSVPTVVGGAYVGIDNGYGELDVSAGYVPIRANGLNVGCASGVSATSDGVDGVVKVSGGAVYIYGTDNIVGYDTLRLLGLIVGNGGCTAVRSGRPYVGRVELTDGCMTNRYGTVVVGMGYGEGSFEQSGGEYYAQITKPVVIGMGGGVGRLSVSGGRFTTSSADATIYVGGAVTNVFGANVPDLPASGYPIYRHDAQGTLSFSGGSMSIAGSVVLGADGSGTLERVGTNGTITIGRDLVFSNTVENAESGGTLAFRLDDSGRVEPIAITGKLVIGPNARLAVDTGDTALEEISCTLLRATGGVEGGFAHGAVTFTGVNRKGMAVSWTPDGSLTIKKTIPGLSIIIR